MHDADLVVEILRALRRGELNTTYIFRRVSGVEGVKNTHSFYRHLRYCLDHRLIELVRVEKKYSIPSKFYGLTEKGRLLLETLEGT